jgi:hypothetical protein
VKQSPPLSSLLSPPLSSLLSPPLSSLSLLSLLSPSSLSFSPSPSLPLPPLSLLFLFSLLSFIYFYEDRVYSLSSLIIIHLYLQLSYIHYTSFPLSHPNLSLI